MWNDAPELPDALPARDVQAFRRAVDAYLDPLRRFVYTYVGSWETAEELVNNTFLQLWLRLREPEPVRDLKAYLYTSARNHAIKHLRHRRVEARHFTTYLEPYTRAFGQVMMPVGDQEVLARELAAALQRAVDSLPPRQREVMLLKWQRQATHEEIGETLGIAPKTVSEHFRRAIAQLRNLLSDLATDPK